jgi:hypothetical protein
MLVCRLGKCGMGGFAEDFNGAGANTAQGFEGYRAERTSGACVVCVVVPALVRFPKSSAVARGASSRTKV